MDQTSEGDTVDFALVETVEMITISSTAAILEWLTTTSLRVKEVPSDKVSTGARVLLSKGIANSKKQTKTKMLRLAAIIS